MSVCITSKNYKRFNVDKIVRDAGPSEFVGWFENATHVVTDSFHGTVFSWVFNKDFYYFLAYEATSSRVKTLLTHLQCEERIVKKEDIVNFCCDRYRPYKVTYPSIIDESKQYIEQFVDYEK